MKERMRSRKLLESIKWMEPYNLYVENFIIFIHSDIISSGWTSQAFEWLSEFY